MEKIIPHLWMDKYPDDPAQFYCSVFKDARIISRTSMKDTPSGDVETATLAIGEFQFILLMAGPEFRFTPAVSFMVYCSEKEEVDRLREGLMSPGKELMPLGPYPFSEHYVWLEDRYGLSWQIMYTRDPAVNKGITPTLMFVGEQCGKAEEAVDFYTTLFPGSRVDHILRYGENAQPNESSMIVHESYFLGGMPYAAMDSAYEHDFTFNEAVSFMVLCDDQAEIDLYWNTLSAHPEAEQCGWLKDRFGISWQIVPGILDDLLSTEDLDKASRITKSFLRMKKLKIDELIKA